MSIDQFLHPLRVNIDGLHELSERFLANFEKLAAESQDQFLATPISGAILRPPNERRTGTHLAIDIGGTNLRVGFVEVLKKENVSESETSPSASSADIQGRVKRHLEQSWPIDEHLKNDNADKLFHWIGSCIAEVVGHGCKSLEMPANKPLSLGITFSFPMEQKTLSEATLMSMGKGFAVSANLDLGSRLLDGYNAAKDDGLPPLKVNAIANDSVSTLVSFIFQFDQASKRRGCMGLILGTGSNATVPLKLSTLHRSKWPAAVSVTPGEMVANVRLTVNTEWSINGTLSPMQDMGLISHWDKVLDSQNETPGFQPLEYMTAGRYLGELGRIMLVDYMVTVLGIEENQLPPRLLQRHGMSTTFLSHFKPLQTAVLLSTLKEEFPESTGSPSFSWTEELAEALYHIAKAIEVRAAGIIAAATLALLTFSEELPANSDSKPASVGELGVGYTGGCIVHFQDYLMDCQHFVDELLARRFDKGSVPVKVVLSPCHDGGITGAGILAAAASANDDAES